MSDNFLFVLTFLTALGCGLVAGVFFGFSTFIMKALARLSPPQGIAAMQSINVVAISPLFMSALFGTAATCLAVAGYSVFHWQEPGATCRVAGGLLYLVGTVGVTIVCNVPRNDALAAVEPADADGARLWTRYVADWTAWNHVRTAAALAAAAALTLALCSPGGSLG